MNKLAFDVPFFNFHPQFIKNDPPPPSWDGGKSNSEKYTPLSPTYISINISFQLSIYL